MSRFDRFTRPFRVTLVRAVCAMLFSVQMGPAQKSPTDSFAQILAQAEARTGDKEWAGAAVLWEKVVGMNPVNGRFWSQLAAARYHARDYQKAVEAYEKVIELRQDLPSNAAYKIASCYALLGEREQAVRWLQKAFAMGFRYLMAARTDADLQSLQDDLRFRNLVGHVDPGATSREDGWRYDLQFLAQEVRRRGYHPFRTQALDENGPCPKLSKEEFDAAVDRLSASIPALTDTEIAIEMTRLLQKLGDGHTSLYGSRNRRELAQTLPVQFYLFEEGLFVIAAAPRYRDLLGAQILRFGDHTPAKVILGLDPTISRDNDIWIRQVAPYRMRNLPILHALGLIPDSQQVMLAVRDFKGQMREIRVIADTTESNIWNVLPNPSTWINLPQTLAGSAPLYLKNTGDSYWFEYLPSDRVVYFQYNKIINDPREPLAAFAERLVAFIDEHDVEKLVIDMRWNNGGDTFLNEPLLHALMRCRKISPPGRFFVIIGRRTFSAALNAACYFERHMNPVFVGEPTGGKPNSTGDETVFTLPFSGLSANVSDLYWQSSWPQDFRTWIAPKIYTPPTFEAFRTNRDPAMEAVLAFRVEP